jgi:predicted metal-dependent hydrolase
MDRNQCSLPLQQDEETVKSRIERIAGRQISLVVTENAASMLSFRKKGEEITLRMHRIFLSAGSEVVDEIGRWVKGKGIPTPLVREFIRRNRESIPKAQPRLKTITTLGRFHNLREIYDEINERYFSRMISAPITWGTETRRTSVRKRTLGSYNSLANSIRINPILDRKRVPRYFLAFIVYHEMLHAAMGVELRNGRRLAHTPEFRRRERLFADYEKARAWEKNNF